MNILQNTIDTGVYYTSSNRKLERRLISEIQICRVHYLDIYYLCHGTFHCANYKIKISTSEICINFFLALSMNHVKLPRIAMKNCKLLLLLHMCSCYLAFTKLNVFSSKCSTYQAFIDR